MYALASATKLAFRTAVAQHALVGDWLPGVATAAGSTSTIVDAGLAGWGDNTFQEWYALAGSDAGSPGQYRIVESFTASTVTLRTVMTAAVGSAKIYYLHKHRPDWYTLAGNAALRKLGPWIIARGVTGHIIPRAGSTVYGLPRNMQRVFRVYQSGTRVFTDRFNRIASTTEPGPNWIETAGNWGVIAERLYSQTDTDANLVTLDVEIKDGMVQYDFTGTTNHATAYRTLALCFRMLEDYLGAIDTNNYLSIRLIGTGTYVADPLSGARVELRKMDGGTESVLASAAQVTVDGTYYTPKVVFEGARIRVFVNDIELINYELLGPDIKYLEGQRVGIRLDKSTVGGAPATDARVDNIQAFKSADSGDIHDYRQEGVALKFGHYPSGLTTVEGGGLLTAMAADTVAGAGSGTIVSDTTAVLEILTTDIAWELLVTQGVAGLMRIALSNAMSDSDRQYYAGRAAEADFLVEKLKETHSQQLPNSVVKEAW